MASRRKRVAVERTLTVTDAVSEAHAIVEDLASEMREAFDNTPESLQQSGVGEARGEAADNLENLSEPDVPEELGKQELKVSQLPLKARSSRPDRMGQATDLLDQVISHLNELDLKDDKANERDELVGELETYKDEADAVEFPGMFG